MAEETTKEFSADIKELGDKIVALTLLQAKSLGDYLKEVHGIEPAAVQGEPGRETIGVGGTGDQSHHAVD